MKTKRFLSPLVTLLLFILVCISSGILAQPPDSLWMHHYGGTDKEIGFDAIEGDPGNFYLVGKTKSYGHGGFDGYILNLDNNGGVVWEKYYGDYLDEQIFSICPALYGGYVMTGYTQTNENSAEIWFLWMDDNGDSLWAKTYGSFSSDQGYVIQPTTDQGYITTSRLTVFQWGDQIYLMKLDQAGDTLWTKTYGTPKQDYGHAVAETSDGGYIIAGRTYTTSSPESGDAWVIKTDYKGDSLWTKKYGGNDEDIFYCVMETEDGYLFTGQTRSLGPGYINVYAVRTDYDGDTIWTRTYGGDIAQNCYALHEKENGNYVLCGYSSSFSAHNDVYMLEIDPDGNMLWQENWGNYQGDEYMYGCRPTADGGYIIAGWTSYYGAWNDELFALKLGPPSSSVDENRENGPCLKVFPNPVQTRSTIHFELPLKTTATLQILNSLGQVVQTLIDSESCEGSLDIEWDTRSFSQGVYFCKLNTHMGSVIRKMIKTE